MTFQDEGERQKPPRNACFGHTSGMLTEGIRVVVQPCDLHRHPPFHVSSRTDENESCRIEPAEITLGSTHLSVGIRASGVHERT